MQIFCNTRNRKNPNVHVTISIFNWIDCMFRLGMDGASSSHREHHEIWSQWMLSRFDRSLVNRVINSVWGGFEMWMILETSWRNHAPVGASLYEHPKKVPQSAERFDPQQTRAAKIKLTIFLSCDWIMHIVSCAWRFEQPKYTER